MKRGRPQFKPSSPIPSDSVPSQVASQHGVCSATILRYCRRNKIPVQRGTKPYWEPVVPIDPCISALANAEINSAHLQTVLAYMRRNGIAVKKKGRPIGGKTAHWHDNIDFSLSNAENARIWNVSGEMIRQIRQSKGLPSSVNRAKA